MSTEQVQQGGRFAKSMKFLGIEFAPVYIPLQRRLQTLAVFMWMSFFLFLGFGASIVLWYLTYTSYQWITYLYMAWVIFDWNTPYEGGRNYNPVRKWKLWQHFSDYFPINLVKTAELDPNRSYLLGSHPHGVLCAGAFCTFATEAMDFSKHFPGLTTRLLTLQGQFWFPVYRELFLSTGSCSATKKGMESLLSKPKGQATVLVVGGALEALNGERDVVKLVLERRKGFIKLALRYGVDLVPTFSFGENLIYDLIPNPKGSFLRRIQEICEHIIGFPPALFAGRGIFQYNFGIVPFRKPITVVVGKPIRVEKIENPTSEDILNMHKKYKESLQELYDEYNPKYGNEDVKLIIE